MTAEELLEELVATRNAMGPKPSEMHTATYHAYMDGWADAIGAAREALGVTVDG